jgi:ATP-dependent DNA ligase
MLLERTLPRGDLWRYEPKLDGFRGLLWRAPSGSVHLLSRNLKDLGHAFPKLVRAGPLLAFLQLPYRLCSLTSRLNPCRATRAR